MSYDLPAPRVTTKPVCEACGATVPRHFQDCVSFAGGEALYAANLEEKYVWDQESWVPRGKGVQIIKAIMYMLKAPTEEDMLKRKAAIDGEIDRIQEAI